MFTRVVLRAAALASRPVLSSPISTTRLLSTKIIRPSRPLASSVSFQRRFASEEATKSAEEAEALEQSSAHENVEETASDPIVEAAVGSVETTTTQVATPTSQEAETTSKSTNGTATGQVADQPPSVDAQGKPVSWDLAPNKTVYVGNLFFDAKPDELKQFFGRYGAVSNIDMITDIRGYSKG
jgi:nucleolin